MTTTIPIYPLQYLLMALCCAPCSVAAAAPERPVGFIYYESGRTIARTSFSLAVVFKDAGVYQGIYFNSKSSVSQRPTQASG